MNTAGTRRPAGAGHSNGGRPVSVHLAFNPHQPKGFLVMIGNILHITVVQV